MAKSAPIDPSSLPRFNVLGIWLTGTIRAQFVQTVLRWIRNRERRAVAVFAADPLLQCWKNPGLTATVNRADAILTDGMPLVFLGRKFAHLTMDRCYGPDTMLDILREGCAQGVRHFLYGGNDEALLDKLESRLRERFPDVKIVGRYCPPFRPLTDAEKADVVARIHASQADVVWVGIGTPKQDYWVGEFRPLLQTPVLISVGAAFNFHAGTVAQAPRWMMRCGLEWLFRLIQEPGRLWRRYLIGNPKFVLLVLRQWITGKPARLCEVRLTYPPAVP